MDLWHTEIKNVSMRIWKEMRWRCNVGTCKAKSMLNKDEGRSSKKHISKYRTSFPMCYVLRGGGRKKCFCLSDVCSCHSDAKLWENEIYVHGHGEAFSPEDRHILGLLTGWGVSINHATAVSSTGASEGLKGHLWVVVSSSQPPPPPPLPSKMCHLNKLTSIRGSILPGVARGLWRAAERTVGSSVSTRSQNQG